MTEKPVKPLSERIREAQDELLAEAKLARDENAPHDASMIALFSLNFGFLAELAEMMEKK